MELSLDSSSFQGGSPGTAAHTYERDFAPGAVLGGSYRLIRRLGRGGMGDIHLASHERLPGDFVVKVLSPEVLSDQDAMVRFRQEAMVMANVRHPNVVQLVDFNSTPSGLPYLVMEYLPGKDLGDILAAREFLSPAQVSMIVRQVACALDAAHRLGIVHRDLKPENIMVVPCAGQGDLIKVIDFGISKARRFSHVTSASMVMGTPEFMSPEQAQGCHEVVDARSDQFALAGIAYLLLTGRTPWGATAPVEILHRIVNKEPLPLCDDDSSSWRSVETVLFTAMAKSPSDRYPSVLAFWRALDRAMVTDGIVGASSEQGSTLPGQDATSVITLKDDGEGPRSRRDGALTLDGKPRDFDESGQREQGEQGEQARTEASEQPQSQSEPGSGEQADPRDILPTRQIPREGGGGGPRHARWAANGPRRRHFWESAVLLLVLGGGAYVGLLDSDTVRNRGASVWRSVRDLTARTVGWGREGGKNLMGKVSRSGRAYVSLDSTTTLPSEASEVTSSVQIADSGQVK